MAFLAQFGQNVEIPGDELAIITNADGEIAYITPDLDNDGAVGSADLLAFLTVFGSSGDVVPAFRTQRGVSASQESTIPLLDIVTNNYTVSSLPDTVVPLEEGHFQQVSQNKANVSISSLSTEVIEFLTSEDFPSNAQLFAFKEPKIYGDELRGQTAELLLDLGQEDFELFAVNLNYELLNADHTK